MELVKAAFEPNQALVLRLDADEDLLKSIEVSMQENNIQDGVVVSGIGTLKTCTMHFTTFVGYPPRDEFVSWDGALELVQMQGVIANGVPHIHMTVSDKEKAVGGHLEEGCTILYLAEIVIMPFQTKFSRLMDPLTTIKQLRLRD